MADVSEETIVISDLLSFLACKVKLTSKNKLLRSLKNFYSANDIAEAHKTLLESLHESKISKYCNSCMDSDSLIAMYDCFQTIPSNELPVFVCKNLNNVPELDLVKVENDSIYEIEDEDDFESDAYGVEKTLREEQKTMKAQIEDITVVVKQLKDQLESISQQSRYQSRSKRKESFTNYGSTKKINSGAKLLRFKNEKIYKKKDLKYLQSLIDEDEEKIENDQCEKDGDSDNQDGIDLMESELEESLEKKKFPFESTLKAEPVNIDFFNNKNEEKRTSEIYLVSPSKTQQLKYLGDEESPSKTLTQQVIYIKNNEGVLEEEENSIEITSSSEYFSNLEEDSLSRIPFELSGEEDFKGEIEIMVDESMIAAESRESFVCVVCEETFDSRKRLKIHIKTHCAKKIFDCILCDEGFQTNEMLQTHYAQCLEVTKRKYNLDAFPCQICGRLYAQERALKQHSYVHSKSRPFDCHKCTYRYLTKSALEAHIKTQHNDLNKYFCPFCDNSYISSGFLKNHLKSHTGERPYACKECGYKGSTPDLLKRHMLTHGPPQQYKCELCNFTCLGIGKLSRHKAKEHKKENIFCTICGKEFNNSCVYHRHYMSHVGEKPFPCSVCSYRAISKEVLLVHMRTHTGDNIINCRNCGVPFGTNYSLKRHLKSFCVKRDAAGSDTEF